MKYSPYRHAQDAMGAFAGKAPASAAGVPPVNRTLPTAPPVSTSTGRAVSANQTPAPGQTLVPGLPGVSVPPRSGVGLNTPNLGATTTNISVPADVVSATGQPSLKMTRQPGGGVVTSLERKSNWIPYLSEAGKQEIRDWAQRSLRNAQNMSEGRHSLSALAKMGHPFAQGKSNSFDMSIVNRQSGTLRASWEVDVRFTTTVIILLSNHARHAQHPAFGTRKMRAHGPNMAAMAKHLPELNAIWRRITREAYLRAQMNERMDNVAPASSVVGGRV